MDDTTIFVLPADDTDWLRRLVAREWGDWDRAREAAPTHPEYVRCHEKQEQLDRLLRALGAAV